MITGSTYHHGVELPPLDTALCLSRQYVSKQGNDSKTQHWSRFGFNSNLYRKS